MVEDHYSVLMIQFIGQRWVDFHSHPSSLSVSSLLWWQESSNSKHPCRSAGKKFWGTNYELCVCDGQYYSSLLHAELFRVITYMPVIYINIYFKAFFISKTFQRVGSLGFFWGLGTLKLTSTAGLYIYIRRPAISCCNCTSSFQNYMSTQSVKFRCLVQMFWTSFPHEPILCDWQWCISIKIIREFFFQRSCPFLFTVNGKTSIKHKWK